MDRDVVKRVLLENGILPNVKGYGYSLGVLLLMSDGESKMGCAYEKVASTHHVKPNTVEKGISNAIEKAFGKSRILARYEKECVLKGKISNKKFFLLLLKQIQSLNGKA